MVYESADSELGNKVAAARACAHSSLEHEQLEQHERFEAKLVHELPQRSACATHQHASRRFLPRGARLTHVHLAVLTSGSAEAGFSWNIEARVELDEDALVVKVLLGKVRAGDDSELVAQRPEDGLLGGVRIERMTAEAESRKR